MKDSVICITGYNGSLTLGKTYEVLDKSKDLSCYRVMDDNGDDYWWYYQWRFTTIKQSRKKKLKKLNESYMYRQ